MNRYIIGLAAVAALAGCNTTPTGQYQNISLTEAELLSEKWLSLQRFPPLYPIEEAVDGTEGCATVEYVITPDYDIKDIKVVSSTSKHFSKQAIANVKKWKWADLPEGIVTAPVKTMTQFQFCMETGDGHCAAAKLKANSQCKGKDAIYSIGYRIKP